MYWDGIAVCSVGQPHLRAVFVIFPEPAPLEWALLVSAFAAYCLKLLVSGD